MARKKIGIIEHRQTTGNFHVCAACDGPDNEVMRRGTESLKQAIKLAKQWGIYGPDLA